MEPIEGLKTTDLTPTKTIEIEGKQILIFDDLFGNEFRESFCFFLLGLDYELRKSFDDEFNAVIERGFVNTLPVFSDLFPALIEKYHSGMTTKPSKQYLSHAYGAAIKFGDSTSIHQDYPCECCVTFLYYGNYKWNGDWCGETIFYNSNHDAVAAVTPKPGRLILFNAALLHRAGVPGKKCPTFRYGFSVFYRCQEALLKTGWPLEEIQAEE